MSSVVRMRIMVLPPPSTSTPDINRGNGVFLPGNLTPGDTSSWKFDQAHSSVLWSANYLGAPGLLTGRFNAFGVSSITDAQKKQYPTTGQPLKDTSWAFYESDPTKTYFNGYVQMNTSNTSEPGRDGGCYLGYVGAPELYPIRKTWLTRILPSSKRQKSSLTQIVPDISAR